MLPSLFAIFGSMQMEKRAGVSVDFAELFSKHLDRKVTINFYFPGNILQSEKPSLLLINDGQDLVSMGFHKIFEDLVHHNKLKPLLCVGIHCSEDRKNEYGMVASLDFKGRGTKALPYQKFILKELMPYIKEKYGTFRENAFAGFSLGALSALDTVWRNPKIFSKVGVFSGSLWWRATDKRDKGFNEFADRIMHQQIRKGKHYPGLKFFFQCSELDEGEDRNNNGVIDSIDDTIDLMRELLAKGYLEGRDMYYLQFPDGRHDVPTWARALPIFLEWGFGTTTN